MTEEEHQPQAAGLFTPVVRVDLIAAEAAAPPSPQLVELAHAHSVATEFWDWQGHHRVVSTGTLRSVLAAMGVDAASPAAVEAALAEAKDRPWRRALPPVVVARQGQAATVAVHAPKGDQLTAWAVLEAPSRAPDGLSIVDRLELQATEDWTEPRMIGGQLIAEVAFALPAELPLGWHELQIEVDGAAGPERHACPLIVVPARLSLHPALRAAPGKPAPRHAWGYQLQLYSVRSRRSWGLGDLADLTELASWSGAQGAGFVLVNPLNAAEPCPPMEPSPYLPTSRRFFNPIYLRVEEIPEVAYLPATDRAIVEWHAEVMRGMNADPGELDRDTVWASKLAALEVIFAQPRPPSRQRAFDAYREREGAGLVSFATWCALAERYGLPTTRWPAHTADRSALAEADAELAQRVEFHTWLQWCLDEQLAKAQRVALESGMGLGIMHDLPVGVHPDGADTWALGDALAQGVTVGAPPDAFNQQGQDWSQPPWRPDRLAELGYAPYRDLLRTVLRHCGALRVDHVIGLFRLWWVPAGRPPAEGTYVRYDHEALVGILALEAHRAGALVVGEDLGTVEPWVRDYLRERGIFGTSILWFEREEGGQPKRPETWRELCLATVTTHDFPPTAGYLAGEHLELRERLGLLTRTIDEERRADEADRQAVLDLLRELGLIGQDARERDIVEALHRFLSWTPAKLIGVSLADAVGDRRAINQPGTSDQYPNWRLPLTDGVAQPILLEDIMTSARVSALARTLTP